jgi:hypothetical protein
MLLFIAFMCFAVLMVSWLVMPDKSETPVAKPVEKQAPDTGAMPARA